MIPSNSSLIIGVFEWCYLQKVLPLLLFERKNRFRQVFRLILRWRSRIRWDKFNILTLTWSNLHVLAKIGPFDQKGIFLTKTDQFDQFRVKISNSSQRIRDFQCKIKQNTCQTYWHKKYLIIKEKVIFCYLYLTFLDIITI